MQEQVRVKQGECEQLEHRHACTVRYYNTTLHHIEALAAQQAAQVGPTFKPCSKLVAKVVARLAQHCS